MQYELTTPIQAHDEELKVLEFKEPTTKTVRKLGLPYKFDETGMPLPVTEIAARYISELAKIPSSSVDQISVYDFNNLCMVVLGFFLNSAQAVEAKLAEQKQMEAESPSSE